MPTISQKCQPRKSRDPGDCPWWLVEPTGVGVAVPGPHRPTLPSSSIVQVFVNNQDTRSSVSRASDCTSLGLPLLSEFMDGKVHYRTPTIHARF